MNVPDSPEFGSAIKVPERQTVKPPEIKKVEQPLGVSEQGIVNRIIKDGDPDLVLQDIAQGETTAKSNFKVTEALPQRVEVRRSTGIMLTHPPEALIGSTNLEEKTLDQQLGQTPLHAKVEIDKNQPQPETKAEFNPKSHEEYLKQQVVAGLLDPEVIPLLAQISPDQQKQFSIGLVRMAPPGSMTQLKALPDIVRGMMADKPQTAMKPLKEAFDRLPRGTKQFTPAEMDALFKEFSAQYYQKLDQHLPARAVLGFGPEEVTPEVLMQRSQQLHNVLREGVIANPVIDFERFLVNRSFSKMQSELQKGQTAKQSDISQEQRRPEVSPSTELQQTGAVANNKETNGLVIQETEKTQTWLDKDRELAFDTLTTQLNQMNLAQTKEWFIGVYNLELAKHGMPLLTTEDVKSLLSVNVQSVSSTELSGQEMNRPVFVFRDLDEYKNFYGKLYPGEKPPAALVNYGFSQDLLSKTGLIVGLPNKDVLGHEVRHTIDPHLHDRKGQDHVLEELFAFYQDTIVVPDGETDKNDLWGSLAKKIGSPTYGQSYARQTGSEFDAAGYTALCQNLVEKTRQLKEKYGDIQAQRLVLQSKTVQDLLSIVI